MKRGPHFLLAAIGFTAGCRAVAGYDDSAYFHGADEEPNNTVDAATPDVQLRDGSGPDAYLRDGAALEGGAAAEAGGGPVGNDAQHDVADASVSDAARDGEKGGGSGGTAGHADGGSDLAGGVTIVPAGASASGVVKISVPLTAVGQGSRYNYQNYFNTQSHYDLTGARLDIVACAPEATGGNLRIYFTTPDRVDSPIFKVALRAIINGFHRISIPVPGSAAGFDPANIGVTRIEVEAGDGFENSWQTPATVVYIDSISTSKVEASSPAVLFNDTFAASKSPLEDSLAREEPGSTFEWLTGYTCQGDAAAPPTANDAGDGGGFGDADADASDGKAAADASDGKAADANDAEAAADARGGG